MNDADPGIHGVPRCLKHDRIAIELQFPLCRLDNTRQHFHQGRFAGAILPQDRTNAPGLDIDTDVVDHGDAVIGLGECVAMQHGTTAHQRPPASAGQQSLPTAFIVSSSTWHGVKP